MAFKVKFFSINVNIICHYWHILFDALACNSLKKSFQYAFPALYVCSLLTIQ